jgi:epoxyqueuosine reductase
MQKHLLSQQIKTEALKLGFTACGIAQADYLAEDADYLKTWLAEGKHGGMSYLERNLEKRTDPRLLFDKASSVIVVLLNYYPAETQDPALPQICKYAYGKDYHEVMKRKLNQLLEYINSGAIEKPVNGRSFADSSAVLERRWAQRAGLGWLGKNCTLINPEFGSYCYIGGIIVDADLEYDSPIENQCGSCTRCLDSCPTNALEEPQHINAQRCITYLNLESKEEIPSELHAKLSNRLYGCDICQDVCPWNKKAQVTTVEEFKPIEGLLELTAEDWLNMSEDEFNSLLAESCMKRAGYKRVLGTAKILSTTNSPQRMP